MLLAVERAVCADSMMAVSELPIVCDILCSMTIGSTSRALCALALTAACTSAPAVEPADTLLTNGRVYTFTWDDPAPDGSPADSAPHTVDGWRPDAEAVAIRAGRIVFTGTSQQAAPARGQALQAA